MILAITAPTGSMITAIHMLDPCAQAPVRRALEVVVGLRLRSMAVQRIWSGSDSAVRLEVTTPTGGTKIVQRRLLSPNNT